MTFIFVRCLRSTAVVTPVKYECDIAQVTSVFIILKNWENNGTEKIGLVTPTPADDGNKNSNVTGWPTLLLQFACLSNPLSAEEYSLKRVSCHLWVHSPWKWWLIPAVIHWDWRVWQMRNVIRSDGVHYAAGSRSSGQTPLKVCSYYHKTLWFTNQRSINRGPCY